MSSELAESRSRRPWVMSLWAPLGYLLIGSVALVLRAHNLGSFVTLDEINFWIHRSEVFLQALQSGDYAATGISDHPGVTTMWLGSAGILLRRGLLAAGLLADQSFSTRLALMRLPVVLAHVLGILLGYGLLRRLLPAAPAVLAAFLWAIDPFLIGYSRLLHVDALAGTFATLSLLAACLYWYHTPRLATLALSGLCAGLAILSKSPALILLPIVGLIALAAWRSPRREDGGWRMEDGHGPISNHSSLVGGPFASLKGKRWSAVVTLLAWCAIVAVTTVALWPALWVSPIRAFQQISDGVTIEGAEPHELGNFFLGQEVDAPGPLFYPVALVLHLFPRAIGGLLLLLWAWRSALPRTRRTLATLAGFVVAFIVAMSAFPKKFDRYLVPVFPALDILAAYGLAWAAARLPSSVRRFSARFSLRPRYVVGMRLAAVSIITLFSTAWWGDYSIAAFNPLLGGLTIGANTFLVGWGEGLEQVAAWLNQQPDITGVLTVSTTTRPLQPYLRAGAQAITPQESELPEKAGYVVIYIRDVMRGALSPPFDQFFEREMPVYTVRIAGVDYAWIYQVPPPIAFPRPADFGAAIHLRGFSRLDPPQRKAPMTIKLFWETYNTPAADYTLFAHLIGPDDKIYAQTNPPYRTSQWGIDRYVTTELPIELPESAPGGIYRLTIGLYNPISQQRLSLRAPELPDPTVDGPDALVLTEMFLR
jgi:4-amino-4-deoxy-L-arabinose transferase-like glycosyltransferase